MPDRAQNAAGAQGNAQDRPGFAVRPGRRPVPGAGPRRPAGPPAASAPQLDAVSTIARIDTDHDGAASRQEWVAYGFHDAGFTAIDTDHDGRVTVAELRAFRARNAKTDAERAALKAENPKLDPDITIRMADADRDGAVSEAEWVAYGNHGGAGFAPVDADHDGRITAEELAAFRKAHPPR